MRRLGLIGSTLHRTALSSCGPFSSPAPSASPCECGQLLNRLQYELMMTFSTWYCSISAASPTKLQFTTLMSRQAVFESSLL